MQGASCGMGCPLRGRGAWCLPGWHRSPVGDGESGCAPLLVARPGVSLECRPRPRGGNRSSKEPGRQDRGEAHGWPSPVRITTSITNGPGVWAPCPVHAGSCSPESRHLSCPRPRPPSASSRLPVRAHSGVLLPPTSSCDTGTSRRFSEDQRCVTPTSKSIRRAHTLSVLSPKGCCRDNAAFFQASLLHLALQCHPMACPPAIGWEPRVCSGPPSGPHPAGDAPLVPVRAPSSSGSPAGGTG